MGTYPHPRQGLRSALSARLRADFVHRSPRARGGDVERGLSAAIMDIEAARSSARGPFHVSPRSPVALRPPRSRRRGARERRDSEAVRSRVRPRSSSPRAAQRRRVRRVRHPGARGPRGGPQATRHVHRLDRRARSAPPDLGDRQQRRRRVAGRLLRPGRGHPARGRRRPGRGQRPRHPHRHRPRPGAAGRDDRADGAPRRRQVRRRRLQGLRWSARRRRQRRQRAVEPPDRRREEPRPPVAPDLHRRRARRRARGRARARAR